MNKNNAETIAIYALSYILSHEDISQYYFSLTGVSSDDLKNNLDDPSMLGAILDFMLQDDKFLIQFHQEHNISPEEVLKARRELPGGQPYFESI